MIRQSCIRACCTSPVNSRSPERPPKARAKLRKRVIFWNKVLDTIVSGKQMVCYNGFVQMFVWVGCSSGLQSYRAPLRFVVGQMHRHHHHLLVLHHVYCLGPGMSHPTGVGWLLHHMDQGKVCAQSTWTTRWILSQAHTTVSTSHCTQDHVDGQAPQTQEEYCKTQGDIMLSHHVCM